MVSTVVNTGKVDVMHDWYIDDVIKWLVEEEGYTAELAAAWVEKHKNQIDEYRSENVDPYDATLFILRDEK
jgi:hypothetical protein